MESLVVRLYSEIDQIHLSSEAQCQPSFTPGGLPHVLFPLSSVCSFPIQKSTEHIPKLYIYICKANVELACIFYNCRLWICELCHVCRLAERASRRKLSVQTNSIRLLLGTFWCLLPAVGPLCVMFSHFAFRRVGKRWKRYVTSRTNSLQSVPFGTRIWITHLGPQMIYWILIFFEETE